jgi:hypothetical protein
MTQSSIRTVSGYLPHVDEACEHASDVGLSYRFAAILESRDADTGSARFDDALFSVLVGLLFDHMASQSCTIETTPDRDRVFHSLDSYLKHQRSQSSEHREPFWRATLFDGQRAVCLLETSAYDASARPAPYADGLTLSIYRRTADDADLRAVCRAACSQLDAEVGPHAQGQSQPKLTFWQHVRQYVG